MLQKVVRKIRRWFHLRKRRRSIIKGEKAYGGMRMRIIRRLKRQLKIRIEKSLVIEDLHRSWKIGEIKPAVKEDLDTLNFRREKITWSELLHIKKRYWHENI